MMRAWWIVMALACVACGGADSDGDVATDVELDAGAGGMAPDAGEPDAGEPDAAAVPDAEAPTCVAWVDACHVRACPSGVVTTRPDGTTCPADACGTGAGPCACRDGVCVR